MSAGAGRPARAGGTPALRYTLPSMSPFIFPIAFMAVVFGGVVVLNERYTLLSADRFPNPAAKIGAYAWLGLFLFGVAFLVTGAALKTPTAKELVSTPFYRIFELHWILIIFLAV